MTWGPLFRLAWADLRGSFAHGLSGFRVLLAGLILGVAAVAASGTVVESINAGLQNNARVLLGGDVNVQRLYRPATAEEKTILQHYGQISDVATLRVMARRSDGQGRFVLSELKAVDTAYPLVGAVKLQQALPLSDVFQNNGVAVEGGLLRRLELQVGDPVIIGNGTFTIRAEILSEPDAAGGAFRLGPRVLTSFEGLRATGLVRPGSMISYKTRIKADDADIGRGMETQVRAALKDESWRVMGLDDAARRSQRFLETVGRFLTWAGLTALLVGGVGVASAVAAVVDARRTVLAILKTQGATNAQIVTAQSLVIGAVALLGIVLGLVLGGLTPWPVSMVMTVGTLPAAPIPDIYWGPLLRAAAFGALITAVFAWWPMLRVRDIPAANLLRDVESEHRSSIPMRAWLVLLILLGGILALMAQTGDTPMMGLSFATGAIGVLALLRLVGYGVQKLVIPTVLRPGTGVLGRLALSNMARRHSPMVSMLVALGLGATVLVSLTQVQGNISNQLGSARDRDYPTYFFIDIQPFQIEAFQKAMAASPQTRIEDMAPMVRGRVVRLNDEKADPTKADPSVRWVLQGDRGFTASAKPPRGAEIAEGDWWSPEAQPSPQVSVVKNVAEGLGVDIGDTVTVNIMGREITATIANLRTVRWASLAMNFAFVFSPGVLDGAPQTQIATVYVEPDQEIPLEHAVAKTLPNVTAIRIADVLVRAQGITDVGSQAVLAVTAVTVLAGLLVLGGAVSAGLRQRLDEAVILKVLGARRRDLLRVTAWEFLGIGVIVGGFAVLAGCIVAWAVVIYALKLEWTLFLPEALSVAVACVAVGLATGGLIAGRILSAKPAKRLRHL